MEKLPAVDGQPAGAQLPICPKEMVKPEDPMLFLVQGPFGDQEEVGAVLLFLASPSHAVFLARDKFDRRPAKMLFFFLAKPEAV